jgi:uncharacterized OB-fold protein
MAIMERITKNTNNRYWYPEENTFPVSNRYTVGVAGQKFFQELKDNAKIMGTACKPCNTTFVPGRLFCERCFARLDDWFDAGTEGTLFSYTLAHVNRDGSAKAKPVLVAAVKIADGILVHWLGECENPVIGMKVAAVFKPAAERKGSILDIKYFKPV